MRRRLPLWILLLASFLELDTSFHLGRPKLWNLKTLQQPSRTTHCVYSSVREQNPGERTVVILYHKPPNVITSHSNADAVPNRSDTKQRRTVYEEISTLQGYTGTQHSIDSLRDVGIYSKLHAIGRLDADTTGLLLLTNDGGLVHHVTNPLFANSISKTYEAVIMGYWNDASPEIEEMRTNGVDIGAKYGGMTKPPVSLVTIGHPTNKSTRVEITIREGKNRQVRRMFHAIRSGVMKLQRTRIGNNLTLGDLAQGEWRILTKREVTCYLNYQLRELTSGPTAKTQIVTKERALRSASKRGKRAKTNTRRS